MKKVIIDNSTVVGLEIDGVDSALNNADKVALQVQVDDILSKTNPTFTVTGMRLGIPKEAKWQQVS